METLLPNVNTSEGCFEIGVTISNPVFTEDAINKRKHERELLNKICILSMLARLRPIGNEYSICTCSDIFSCFRRAS
ncbi:TPA: cell division inhibition protein DicB [Escherichia coli]